MPSVYAGPSGHQFRSHRLVAGIARSIGATASVGSFCTALVLPLRPYCMRMADRIRKAHERTERGRQDWIESTLELRYSGTLPRRPRSSGFPRRPIKGNIDNSTQVE